MTQTLVKVTQLHIQNLLTWTAKKYVLVASVVARADPNFVDTSYLVTFVLFFKAFYVCKCARLADAWAFSFFIVQESNCLIEAIL
jgi:hypothetical protein